MKSPIPQHKRLAEGDKVTGMKDGGAVKAGAAFKPADKENAFNKKGGMIKKADGGGVKGMPKLKGFGAGVPGKKA